jgi:hypothetical protein
VPRAARLSSFPIRVFLAEAWLLDVTTLYCVQNYRLQETPCQRQSVFNIWWMWRHHKNWCLCYAHDTYPTAWYRDNFVDCERTHLFTTGFFMKFCLFFFTLLCLVLLELMEIYATHGWLDTRSLMAPFYVSHCSWLSYVSILVVLRFATTQRKRSTYLTHVCRKAYITVYWQSYTKLLLHFYFNIISIYLFVVYLTTLLQ